MRFLDPDPIEQYGRKYTLAVLTLMLGFVVTIIALAFARGAPQYVAEIVGTFGILASVAIGAYSGSNAFVASKRVGNVSSSKTTTMVEEERGPAPTPPPARPSGAIKEEDG